MRLVWRAAALLILVNCAAWAEDAKPSAQPIWRVLPAGEQPPDARLGKPRDLKDEYHPWTPPTDKAAWERTAKTIRRQALVSLGLWPMPPKTPLNPVIHGKINRGDYTVEKVYFSSLPGFYVTGNLYRPKNIQGEIPGVLCPHGHWPNGRFHDAGPAAAAKQLEQGAEEYMSGARFPLQARMIELARMGCVVFHYDMIGYADSRQLDHRTGFSDVESGLRLQSIMGLQTWNSTRALDFLLSLPEVDDRRIGVTGASGGGTQTFLLGAVDPRPTVAFPAVMVSTAMQGGCVCENAPYLRLGLNNVALAATFAPKPMAMTGAHDWTIDIETKGLPELKLVYSLSGAANLVAAKCYPQFEHNYNQVSREMMFNWFNEHLPLGLDGRIEQTDFWPLTQDQMTVYDKEHPLPGDAKSLDELKNYLAATSDEQFTKLIPARREELDEYRDAILPAAQVMLAQDSAARGSSPTTRLENLTEQRLEEGTLLRKGLIQVAERQEPEAALPFVQLIPTEFTGRSVVWIDGQGKSVLFGSDGQPIPAVQQLLACGRGVISADVFQTGEYLLDGKPLTAQPVNETYYGYTFCYNRPLLSNRVRDIRTVCRELTSGPCDLVGTGEAGPWVLLAAAVGREKVIQAAVDLNGFSFSKVERVADPMFLPGALKYGGIGGLAALAAPARLTLFGTEGSDEQELRPLTAVYQAARTPLDLQSQTLTAEQIVERLLK